MNWSRPELNCSRVCSVNRALNNSWDHFEWRKKSTARGQRALKPLADAPGISLAQFASCNSSHSLPPLQDTYVHKPTTYIPHRFSLCSFSHLLLQWWPPGVALLTKAAILMIVCLRRPKKKQTNGRSKTYTANNVLTHCMTFATGANKTGFEMNTYINTYC